MIGLAWLSCAAVDSGTAAPAVPCDTGLTEAQATGLSAAARADYGTLIDAGWTQGADATAWVEYQIDGGDWLSSPRRVVQAGTASALLLGIPYDSAITWRVVNDFCAGPLRSPSAAAATSPPPAGLPLPIAVEGDPERWDAATRYVLASMNDTVDGNLYWSFIIDRQGRVVWARRNPRQTITLHPRITHDGDAMLIDQNTFWGSFDGGAGSQVLELAIDGTVLHTYDTPGLRHPFTDGPDRSIVWGAYQSDTETLESVSVGGEQRTLWDCQDFLNSQGAAGSCTSNTVSWDPATGHYLYSFYTLETVFELDADGAPLRWFGHLPGAWSFDPVESTFWWQHGGYYTDQGTLLIASHLTEDGVENVAREYVLDEDRRALVEIWSFGVGLGVYGDELGEAHRLPGGDTLQNYGTEPRLREATPGGDVVWDIQWDQRYIGRSTPIGDLYDLAL